MTDIPDSHMPKPKKRTTIPRDTARHITNRIRKATRESKRANQAREAKASYEMLQRHANQLAEHFGNVQIVATKINATGSTLDFAAGSGDLHARVHMTGCWADRIEGHYREGM